MSRMQLKNIESGASEKPLRVLIYGDGGIGKTSFGASAPKPIFIAPENGFATIAADRFPSPETWEEVLEAVDVLTSQEHPYKTVVLDSLDWIEPLLFSSICKRANVDHMEDVPYGKLYAKLPDEWSKLLVKLEKLQSKKGMHVVLISHQQLRNVVNPEGADYTRTDIKLRETASVKPADKIKEWCDAVLFACIEIFSKDDGKAKAGIRLMKTGKNPAYYAKNRYNLPEKMALSWAEFFAATRANLPMDPASAKEEITQLIQALPPDLQAKVTLAVTKAKNDAVELVNILNQVRAKVS